MSKKILIITRNLPPLWGGMERLVWYIVETLSKTDNVMVIGPKGCKKTLPEGVSCSEVPLHPLFLFLWMAKLKALWQGMRFEPQIVIAGSGLTAPFAWIAARMSGARAFAYVHGLDLAVPHPMYRTFWLPFLRSLDGIIANSRATAALVEQIGVARELVHIIHPGVAMVKHDTKARVRFRARYGLGERPVLLSVGRLTRRKGLTAFVRDVLPKVVSEKLDACLLIVGDVPKGALAAQAEKPKAILVAAKTLGIANNVKWLGPLFGNALDSAYCAADIHVFPVQYIPNDPEGFGMVAVEAAAHGTPTVAYATGGVVDAVADGISGRLVAPGDAEAFALAILNLLKNPLDSNRIRGFAKRFAWPHFQRALIRIFDK